MASTAAASSSPLALTMMLDPRPAARSRIPRIDLPSTSSSPFWILMSERKRAATCTSFAAARAWRPSLFLISRVRSINTPLLRARSLDTGGLCDRASSCDGSLIPSVASCRRQQIGGHADGLGALLADDVRQAGHVRGIVLHGRELDDHREIHAGQDLHTTLLQEREADVAGGPAEHVGEDNHAVVGSDAVEGLADFLAGLVPRVGPLERHGFDHTDVRFNLSRRRQQLMREVAMRDDQGSDQ